MDKSHSSQNLTSQDKLKEIFLLLKVFIKVANITIPLYIDMPTTKISILIVVKFKDVDVSFSSTSLKTMYTDSIVWIEEMETLYKQNKNYL